MPNTKSGDDDDAKMRMKSTKRKPLRDVSNAKSKSKSKSKPKPTAISKIVITTAEEEQEEDAHDRLLLVHSNVSSLLHQIDELVVQALQLTSNKGWKEIKQFANVLSEMQTSLKPWVPRFQNAVSTQSLETETISKQQTTKVVPCVSGKDAGSVTESPEPTKWESLISPSPLVSWRAECNTQGGRQLFLLTPLLQTKTIQKSVAPSYEKITSNEIAPPICLFDSVGNLNEDLPQGISDKSIPSKVLNIEAGTKTINNFKNKCASPAQVSRLDCPTFAITPRLNISPPKSCKLLEPVSAFSRKKKPGGHKNTPFPVRSRNATDSPDSESPSNQISDDLTLKYPELFGINLAHNTQNRLKSIEESPIWSISPPKTCAIMEPSDEKTISDFFDKCSLVKTDLARNQKPKLTFMTESGCQCDQDISTKINHHKDNSNTLSTPMMKEPASSFQTRKHLGENTLKKELWTRFEAASSYDITSNGIVLQNTINKGFLDRLDEASEV